jgi:GNAT superfamily N-acetyltransferase
MFLRAIMTKYLRTPASYRRQPQSGYPHAMDLFVIRPASPADEPGAYHVCLKTGDHGQDGEPFYRDDPDALGRIYVGPYLAFEPELSLVLEDGEGICGYALGAFDSRAFYARYDAEWRPALCASFAAPQGNPNHWTRVQHAHHIYHHPDYLCPEPYLACPSHLHIDLLPRAQGRGYGRRMVEQNLDTLRRRGSRGAHLGVSVLNTKAYGFYRRLGFEELIRVGSGEDGCIYMGLKLAN